MPIGYLLFY